MKVFIFVTVFFLAGARGFCDTASDIKTFFKGHADMFAEILKRYNDKVDYKVKPLPGQKHYHIRQFSFSKRKGKAEDSSSSSGVPAPDPPRVFTSKSAWADLKATVINYHTHYVIKVESSAPAEKWILEKNDNSHAVISSGGLNDQYDFVIDQPGNFVPGRVNLRVINMSDGNQYPSLFPLK